MKIPESLQIQNPDSFYTFSDHKIDQTRSSVAAAFFNAEEEQGEHLLKSTRYKMKNSSYHEYSDAERKQFQTEYENALRAEMDKRMQKAILANGGVVGAFPKPTFEFTVTYSQTKLERDPDPAYRSQYDEPENKWTETGFDMQSFHLSFDYFRGVEKEADIPYTSYYSNPSAENLVKKEAELKERMTRVLNRGKERLKRFLGRLPTYLTLALDVLLVWSAFANRDLYLTLAHAIPFYDFCSAYGGGISFVHLVGMPLLSIFVSVFATAMLDPVVIKGVSKKQAVADYENLAASKDYIEAKKTLETERPAYDRLMMEFYTAWYRQWKKTDR